MCQCHFLFPMVITMEAGEDVNSRVRERRQGCPRQTDGTVNMGVKKQSREPMSLEEFLHHLFVGSGSFYIGGRDGGLYSYELSDGKLT